MGAGASLLGAWMTEWNKKNAAEIEKATKQAEARSYLMPELNRIIERVIYIHGRAIPNFVVASLKTMQERQGFVPDSLETGDVREDFMPFHPVLYPNSERFRDLPANDAVALIAFYDSLHSLSNQVADWWERQGQLSVNVFNSIMHRAEESLRLALACINTWDSAQSPSSSLGALTSKIKTSLLSANQARKAHSERFEKKI